MTSAADIEDPDPDLADPDDPDEYPHGERPMPQTERLDAGAELLARAAERSARAIAKEIDAVRSAQRTLRLWDSKYAAAERTRREAADAWARAAREIPPALDALEAALAATSEPCASQLRRFGVSAIDDLLSAGAYQAAERSRALIAAVRASGDARLEPALAVLEHAVDAFFAGWRSELAAIAAKGPIGRTLLERAHEWDLAYLAVKRRAARAEREGRAPGLHAHLFGDRTLKERLRACWKRAAFLFVPGLFGEDARAAFARRLAASWIRRAAIATVAGALTGGTVATIASSDPAPVVTDEGRTLTP